MLNALEKNLKQVSANAEREGREQFGWIFIDGQVQHKTRQDLIDKFQENPKIRFAILSITCAGIGITLTAASTVVFAEYIWTPSLLVQAEDSAHRIGQKNCVNVVYLHAEETVDDIMWDKLQKKII